MSEETKKKLRNHPTNPEAVNLIKGNTLRHLGRGLRFSHDHPETYPLVRLLKEKKFKSFVLARGAKSPGKYHIECNAWIAKNKAKGREKIKGRGRIHQLSHVASVEITDNDLRIWKRMRARKRRKKLLRQKTTRPVHTGSQYIASPQEKSVRQVFDEDLVKALVASFS